MKILALYAERTLSLVRRVLAPFSVLSTRGHSFSFLQVPAFDAAYAGSYDLTVLPNWILNEREVATLQQHVEQNHTCFVYDLSDSSLLQLPQVLDTLRSCTLITVPTEYTAKEVRIAVPGKKVVVLPSTIDIPFMMDGIPMRPDHPLTIGCFGPFDWDLVHGVLLTCREEGRALRFIGDVHAHKALGDLVIPIDSRLETYPTSLRRCHFGLLPQNAQTGRDPIWQHEYGIFAHPVLAFPPEQAQRPEKWLEGIKRYSYDAQKRASAGMLAQEEAKQYSAVRLADLYLKAYRQMLPRVAALR